MKSTPAFLSLLSLLATATAQAGQSPDEIQCLARCEANTTCQSVFTNRNTGECQNFDCRFTKKPESGWSYAEAVKPNPTPCPDNIPVPSGITLTVTGAPLPTPTGTGAPPASKTTGGGSSGPTNAALRVADAAGGAVAWAVGGLLMAALG